MTNSQGGYSPAQKGFVGVIVGTIVYNVMPPGFQKWIKQFGSDILTGLEVASRRRAASQAPRLVQQQPVLALPPPNGAVGPIDDLPIQLAPFAQRAVLDVDDRWRSLIVHPSIVLLLGRRGSGKSALAYRLLGLLRHRAKVYYDVHTSVSRLSRKRDLRIADIRLGGRERSNRNLFARTAAELVWEQDESIQ